MQTYEVDVFKVKKEYDKQEFLRRALTALADEKNTPTDIFESRFDEVEECEPCFIQITADTQISFTADVGYDRKATINGTTKTVTDWQPYSGTNQSCETVFLENGTDYNFDIPGRLYAEEVCGHAESETLEEDDGMLSSATMNEANDKCIWQCFRKVKFPGDRHQNEHYSGTVNIIDINKYYIPMYRLHYNYKGKEFSNYAFASGNKMPQTIGKSATPSAASEIGKEAMKISKFLFMGMAAAVLLAIILVIVAGLFGWLIPSVAALVLLIAGTIIYKKTKKSIYDIRQKQKHEALNKYLKTMGLFVPNDEPVITKS